MIFRPAGKPPIGPVLTVCISLLISAAGWHESVCRADTAAAVSGGLTMARCLELARANNPDLNVMLQAEASAAAEIPAASADLGPTVALAASGRVVSVVPEMNQPDRSIDTPMGPFTIPGSSLQLGDHDSWETSMTVSQTFYAGGRLNGAVDLARLRRDAVISRTAILRAEIDSRTAALYLDLARLLPLRDVASARLDTAREHAADVRELIAGGVMTDNEGLKADLKVSEAEQDLIARNNQIVSALDALAQITAHRFDPPETLPLPGIDLPVMPSPGAALNEAITRRPELAEIEATMLAVRKQVDLIDRTNRPVVTGYGKAAFGKPGPDFIANDWIDYYEAGLQVRMNLWDNRRVGSRSEAAALELERLRRQYDAAVSHIDLDIRQALTRITDARMRLDVAGRAVATAEENFRVTRERFESGVLTHTDYLDAETALYQTRCNRLILEAELQKAWLSYHVATGRDLVEEAEAGMKGRMDE